MRRQRLLVAAIVLGLAPLPSACSRVVNPATGESELTAMSPEQELQVGREQHPQVLAEFGGEYPDPALQAYVQEVGQELSAVSELPDLPFTFTLLNSEMVNAFALPGGYVYVTRGLVALADDEAELAGVLAHEIGHVTARHSAQRYSRGVLAQGGLVLGTIVAGVLGGGAAAEAVGVAGGAGAKAGLAGYSRDQEFQADDLGVRYLGRAGYDPGAMPSFLEKLERNDALARQLAGKHDAAAASWFATHPGTPDRVERAEAQAAAGTGQGRSGKDAYLSAIDGLIYGQDPSQGFVRGRRFVHPGLRLGFEAPQGFRLQNLPSAVIGRDRNGRIMKFDGDRVPAGQSAQDYLVRGWAEGLALRNVQRFEVNGLEGAGASTSGRLSNGQAVDVGLAVVRVDDSRVYRFLFISAAPMGRADAAAFEATVRSFRRLSADEAAALQPHRIEVVTVEQGQTRDDLALRMAVDGNPLEQFEVLNGLDEDQPLVPGQRVKLVVDG
jgi:predicted Zn-dependent protease